MATSFADPRIVPSARDWGIGSKLYNFDDSNFRKYQKQLNITRFAANAGSGIGVNDTKVLTIGDSLMSGIGGSLAGTQLPITSWPNHLARRFTENGIPSTLAGTIAVTAGVGGSWIDNRFSLGGWGTVGGLPNIGWSPGATTGFIASNTNGQTCVFTPGFAWDRANITYLSSTATGAFSIQATGGGVTNIPAGATPPATSPPLTATVSAATLSAANTVTLIRTATEARYAYVCMIEVWNSAQPQIRVSNVAVSGSSAQGWNGVNGGLPTASPLKMIEQFGPHLGIIGLGGNDITIGRTVPQFLADMTNIVNSIRLTGDVVFKTSTPVGNAGFNTGMRAYFDALIGAGLPVIDAHARIGPFAQYDTDGYMNADDIHGNDANYGQQATMVAEALRGF